MERGRPFCFTSTEARWLIRDGDRWGRGRKEKEKKTGETMDRRQNNVHCAIAVSTAVLGRVTKTMSVALLC